jgi:predicted ATPase
VLKSGRGSAYVVAAGESFGIRPTVDLWVDVDLFESELARAESLPPSPRREALRSALSLWRGDLLADEPYADWPVARRETLHRSRERTTLHLASLDRDAGEPLATVSLLEGLLGADNSLEEAHRALIYAYAAAGQREQALRQYERCREALRQDLGVEPSPETRKLVGEIRATAVTVPSLLPTSGGRALKFSNLPALPTPTIGREREIDDVQSLLRQPRVRLATIVGPGGIGKTRLAIEVAAGLADDTARDVGFVPLAAVKEPEQVMPAIAQSLRLRPQAARPIEQVVADYLHERKALLVLDNFEQVVEAAPRISDLLASCPDLTVVTTSREPLDVRGEHVYRLDVLGLPDLGHLSPRVLERTEAVALFLQTVRAHRPEFALTAVNAPAIAELCVRLDGLPLAIEIAATRARHLPADRLLDQIGQRLGALDRGPRDLPERQRTLHATVAWSYDLLGNAEQALFRRFAVFTGGAERDAVRAVAGDDAEAIVYSLADKSLLQQVSRDGRTRFLMLETIRVFADEQLTAHGERESYLARHADFYANLAVRAEPELAQAHQVQWLEHLNAEIENFRAAATWSLDQGSATHALRIGGRLGQFWGGRALRREAFSWLERALALQSDAPDADRAIAAHWAAVHAGVYRDYEQEEHYHALSRSIWQQLDDRQGLAIALTETSTIRWRRGDYDGSTRALREALALFREAGDRRGTADCLTALGALEAAAGRIENAIALYRESLSISEPTGDLRRQTSTLIHFCSELLELGEKEEALVRAKETEQLARLLDDSTILAHALYNQTLIAFAEDDDERAFALAMETLALMQAVGQQRAAAVVTLLAGTMELRRGRIDRAAANYARALPVLTSNVESVDTAHALQEIAQLALAVDRPLDALSLMGAAAVRREELKAPVSPFDRPRFDAVITGARDRLGDQATDDALANSRTLAIETAIDLARELATTRRW